jgi:peptide/nickel transport system substrate-binding protein
MLKEINIVDDFIIDIITFEPYPILLNKLTNVYIISKKYHENNSNEIQVGTGAYRFSEYIENNHIILVRFDEYWKKTPDFQNIIIKFYNEYEDRINELIIGGIDMIDFVLPGSIDNLSEKEYIKAKTFLHPIVTYLSFDFRENNSCCYNDGKNPFSDLRVRKAVYHAINITNIIDNIFLGYAETASQFVTPYIFGYNPSIKKPSFNLEKAQQYMKEAGYENGFDVVLDTTTLGASREIVSKNIADQLLNININVKLNILSSNDFYNKIMNRNSSFYLIGWGVDSGDAGEIFENILRSVDIDKGYGLLNFGNYSNPEIDKIAIDIFYNMDPVERLYLMQEGFSIAMDDVACIPLYVYYGISAMNNEISWKPRVDGLIKFEDIKINT